MADLAAARREAERALDRWDSLPVTHRYDYEAAEVIRALRSLLAATLEPTGLRRTRAYRLLERGVPFLVVREDEPYAPAVVSMIRAEEQRKGTWTKEDEERFEILLAATPEPAPALPEEVREAAEMLRLTLGMREAKHACGDRACSNVALGALNLLAALGGAR